LNEHAKAIKDYDEAIRLDPENDSAWNNRGYSKNQLSCWDEAIRDLDQAIALDENSFTAYAHRGAAKLGLGLTQAGVRDIA
jgi:tetratricopeptide (TPR) repeat protein